MTIFQLQRTMNEKARSQRVSEISAAKANQAMHLLCHPLPVFAQRRQARSKSDRESGVGGRYIYVYVFSQGS